MKPVGMISMGALFLLLGSLAPVYAGQEDARPPKQEEKAQPQKQEERAQPAKQEEKAKPERQEERAQPSKQEEKAQPQKQEERAQPAKQEEKARPEKQEERAQPAKQEEKAQPQKQEERAQPAKQEEHAKAEQHPQQVQRTKQAEEKQRAEPALRLSSNSHRRIPDEHFRGSFGSEHRFRIDSPRIVDGYSRFQYGGYWFGFVQPWPGDWYYTDQVYVDYVDGGYYLYNPSYPDTRIEISVVL